MQFIVIASIHQPSAAVFRMFDKLNLLSNGMSAYFGSMERVAPHFESIGCPIPHYVHPAEYLLELVQTDFLHSHGEREGTRPGIEAIIAATRTTVVSKGTIVV